MRCLRVSVQAGLTPDGLGPRPDCSSAGWRIDGLHSSCTHAFSNVTHSTRVQGTDGNAIGGLRASARKVPTHNGSFKPLQLWKDALNRITARMPILFGEAISQRGGVLFVKV